MIAYLLERLADRIGMAEILIPSRALASAVEHLTEVANDAE